MATGHPSYNRTLRIWTIVVVLLHVLVFENGGSNHAIAQTTSIVDADPFDRLAYKDGNGKVVTQRILPVDRAQREKWLADNKLAALQIRLLDNLDQIYEIRRADIVKLEFFDDRLASEARSLLAKDRFDESFRYILRLHRDYSDRKDLAPLLRDFLIREADHYLAQGNAEAAWIRLDEAYGQAPDDSKVQTALGTVLDRLVQESWDRGNHAHVMSWLDQITTKYGASQSELLAKWRSQLDARLAEYTEQLEAAMQAQDFLAAYEIASRARALRPESPRLLTALNDLEIRFPTVRVGVTSPSNSLNGGLPLEWQNRRVARLLGRTLMEAKTTGTEGCSYSSPVGTAVATDDPRVWELDIHDPRDGTDFWISQAILQYAREPHPLGDILAGLGPTVARPHPGRIRIEVGASHLLLTGLLRMPLAGALPGPQPPSTQQLPPDRAYSMHATQEDTALFVANPDYRFRANQQIQQVVERTLISSREGIEALRADQMDVVDRVFPAEVPRLLGGNTVTLVPYAIPSVHVLVPNLARPWMTSRTFRRGITYLLDRESILQRTLLGGQPLEGCRVMSGPLPAGKNPEDPIAYAYDESIAPFSHDVGTGLVLIKAAMGELQRTRQLDLSLEKIELRVAHYAGEIATEACTEICRRWSALGLKAVPVPMPKDAVEPTDEWDLWYRDLVLQEPLVDVAYFLDQTPQLPRSPYLNLGVLRAQAAADWPTARLRLRELHRAAHEDVTVIPLWQLQDYAARRRVVSGLGAPLMSLYESVEAWSIPRPGSSSTVGVERTTEGAP